MVETHVRRMRASAALFCLFGMIACGEGEPVEEPAHVENPVAEVDLTTVRLTAQAVERVGIEVGAVTSRELRRHRALGGELLATPGSAVRVSAPRAATVLPPANGVIPSAGATASEGQALLRLAILPSGDALGGADEALAAAEARLGNARAKADRALTLLNDSVGSRADYEDARAELEAAEAEAVAWRARGRLLSTGGAGADAAGLSLVVLTAPRSGSVLSLNVTAGQTVVDGAPLLEIVDADPLWVRVPLYAGDANAVDAEAPARILGPSEPPGAEGVLASRVQGPLTANAGAASIDLYYEMENADLEFRPGQRVTARVPLSGSASVQTVVPWSAVMLDINGGAWIYEVLEDRLYARRRVEVTDVVNDYAVLGRGPPPGTPVVVVGAAELYSTEFGDTSH